MSNILSSKQHKGGYRELKTRLELLSDTTSVTPQESITISLTKGYSAVIDAIDADLAEFKWTAQVQGNRICAVRAVRISGKKHRVFLHRIILERMLSRPLLKTEITDHIDSDALNNTRSNLRLATNADNARNRRRGSRNTSGYKGVAWNKDCNRWSASIRANGQQIYLGLFDTPGAAHLAYCRAAVKYHGEFARFI